MTNKLAVFENNTPSGTKKHRKSTEPESRQTEKMFFFLSSSSSSSSPSSSSDGLVQICITLSQWFSHKTAAFSTEQCTSPSVFSRFEVSRSSANHSLKNYGFLCDAIFSSHVRLRTNHLAMKCNYYAAQDCWIRNTVGMQGVFEESLVCRSGQWLFGSSMHLLLKEGTQTRIKKT